MLHRGAVWPCLLHSWHITVLFGLFGGRLSFGLGRGRESVMFEKLRCWGFIYFIN